MTGDSGQETCDMQHVTFFGVGGGEICATISKG